MNYILRLCKRYLLHMVVLMRTPKQESQAAHNYRYNMPIQSIHLEVLVATGFGT